MNYLLDTHTFIWWDADPEKLPANILAVCQQTEHPLFLSIASIWEMQIKEQLGKLDLRLGLERLVSEQIDRNDIKLLAVKPAHVLALSRLPDIHKNPFDRVLISQSRCEKMTLLSSDAIMQSYPVELLWSQ